MKPALIKRTETQCFQNSGKVELLVIDPGEAGGIVEVIGSKVTAVAMPDDDGIDAIFANFVRRNAPLNTVTGVYMEKVGGFIGNEHGEGVAVGPPMFNFGDGFGFLRGLCKAYKLKLNLVLPKEWQKGIPGSVFPVGTEKRKTLRKNAYKAYAQKLFPDIKVTLATADALCIAAYAVKIQALRNEWKAERSEIPDFNKTDFGAFSGIEFNPSAEQLAITDPIEPQAPFPEPVAILDRPLSDQMKAADKWAEQSGYPVPKRRTQAHAKMFSYWLGHIAPQ